MTSKQIIEKLKLVPLEPEGGFFRQIYRSSQEIETKSGRRPALTSIYYLLTEDTFSAFHRLKSDEIYHFYSGTQLELILLNEEKPTDITRVILGPDFDQGDVPFFIVPAGVWQASRLLRPEHGAWALLGTTVSPGFEMEDFELVHQNELATKFPGYHELIGQLCRN